MFSVHFDSSRDLLRIHYSERVSPDETRACLERVKSLLENVEPGFELLADFTGLSYMDTRCAPHVAAIMDCCNEKGVAIVLRVIPDPQKDIGLAIMSFFHYGRGVRMATYESLEQAEMSLDQ